MKAFIMRFGAYMARRLSEPSSWAAIIGLMTSIGVKILPDQASAITDIGVCIFSGLLFAAREGRDKPDNPTIGTVIKGEMPPPKPDIVPPPKDAKP